MASPAENAALMVRDPAFQALGPEAQVDTFKRFIASNDPEFVQLDPIMQTKIATDIMGQHDPTLLEQIGETATAVGRFLPVTSEAIQIGEAAMSPETTRPWAQAIADFFGGGESGAGRALATAALVGLEDLLLFPLGMGLGRAAIGATRFGRAATGALVREGTEAATRLATQRAAIEPVLSAMTGGATTGALFGVADALERQEIRPLEQFVLNPLMMAGFMTGIHMAFGRRAAPLPPETVAMGTQALQVPIIKQVADMGVEFAKTMAKEGRVPDAEAGRIMLKGLAGQLDEPEFRVFQRAIRNDPEALKSDVALKILDNNRAHLETKIFDVDEPLRVTFERGGRTETVLPASRTEALDLARQHMNRDIHVLEVAGTPKDVRPFTGLTKLEPTTPEPIPLPGQVGEPPPIVGTQRPLPVAPAVAEARSSLPTQREVAGVEPPPPQLPSAIEGTSQPLNGPLPTMLEAGMERMGMDPVMARQPLPPAIRNSIRAAVEEGMTSPLTRELGEAMRTTGTLPTRTPQPALPQGVGAVGPDNSFVMQRSSLPTVPGPGATVKVMETGMRRQVTGSEGPIVILDGNIPAIPLSNGEVRTTLPTRSAGPGRPARKAAELNDLELAQSAAMLNMKMANAKGAAFDAVAARQAEILGEITRRNGRMAGPPVGDGAVGRQLVQCL